MAKEIFEEEFREVVLIGEVIIPLRKAIFSQDELAAKSRIDRSYMHRIETNKSEPSLGTTFALAKALGLKASELVKIIEESPNTVFEKRERRKSKKK